QIKAHVEEKTGNCMKGKVCIVTGAESLKGIGAQHIYVLDKSTQNLPNLQSTVQSKYPGGKITCIAGDAADEAAIKALCARALVEEGRLDVFFANVSQIAAGHRHTVTRLQDADPDVFMRTMRINTLSPLTWSYKAAGIRSGAGPLDYSASKAAVNSLAQTGASQFANTNVRVNSICPGLTETGMTESAFEYARNRGTIGKVGQLNPLGRFAIAEVALFFASDQSSYVNGQTSAVDGGHSASLPVMPGRWM
ncbi:NAD(P)-binding protein, partial [Mycena albidolilacea]